MAGKDPIFLPFSCESQRGLTLRGSYHGVQKSGSPLVIICHGFTGQRCGPGYLFVKISRALAEAGFPSLRFDFTGSGESEGVFSEMNTATMMADLVTVANVARKTFSVDKLLLCGHSFGGMVAARCAGALDAAGCILLAPVGDPMGLVKRRKALLEAGPNPSGYYENGPHEMHASFLESLSGFNPSSEFQHNFKGHLLLIQGDADFSIAVDESYSYVTAAHNALLDTDYLLVKGSDHNFSRVSDVNAVLSRVTSWTKEHFSE